MSNENALKILIKCKQLLKTRRLCYNTLQCILNYKELVDKVKKNIDKYFVNPNEYLRKMLEKICNENLTGLLELILSSIEELRSKHNLFSGMIA